MSAHQGLAGVPLMGVDDPGWISEADTVQHLLEVVGQEPRALAQLCGCVEQLSQVQAAKQSLAQMPARTLRVALAARAGGLGGLGGGQW